MRTSRETDLSTAWVISRLVAYRPLLYTLRTLNGLLFSSWELIAGWLTG